MCDNNEDNADCGCGEGSLLSYLGSFWWGSDSKTSESCPQTPEGNCPTFPEGNCPTSPEENCPTSLEESCPQPLESECRKSKIADCSKPQQDFKEISVEDCQESSEPVCPKQPRLYCSQPPPNNLQEPNCACIPELFSESNEPKIFNVNNQRNESKCTTSAEEEIVTQPMVDNSQPLESTCRKTMRANCRQIPAIKLEQCKPEWLKTQTKSCGPNYAAPPNVEIIPISEYNRLQVSEDCSEKCDSCKGIKPEERLIDGCKSTGPEQQDQPKTLSPKKLSFCPERYCLPAEKPEPVCPVEEPPPMCPPPVCPPPVCPPPECPPECRPPECPPPECPPECPPPECPPPECPPPECPPPECPPPESPPPECPPVDELPSEDPQQSKPITCDVFMEMECSCPKCTARARQLAYLPKPDTRELSVRVDEMLEKKCNCSICTGLPLSKQINKNRCDGELPEVTCGECGCIRGENEDCCSMCQFDMIMKREREYIRSISSLADEDESPPTACGTNPDEAPFKWKKGKPVYEGGMSINRTQQYLWQHGLCNGGGFRDLAFVGGALLPPEEDECGCEEHILKAKYKGAMSIDEMQEWLWIKDKQPKPDTPIDDTTDEKP